MSNSITEALNKTANGNTQILKVKKYREDVKDKVNKLKTLKALAHSMLVNTGYDYGLFQEAKPFIRKICLEGTDKQYNNATIALKMMFVTTKQCSPKTARKAVINSLEMTV